MQAKTTGHQPRSTVFFSGARFIGAGRAAESAQGADATKCRGIVYVQAEGADLPVIPLLV
jgi:hypothetical protein